MPPLPSMTVREVEAVLRRAGFVLDRQRGHRMWCKGERCVPVPRHAGDVPKGTLRSIIDWADMTIDEFLRLR